MFIVGPDDNEPRRFDIASVAYILMFVGLIVLLRML